MYHRHQEVVFRLLLKSKNVIISKKGQILDYIVIILETLWTCNFLKELQKSE